MNDDNRERRWAQRIRRVPKPDAGAVEPLWKPPTGRRRGRRPKARRIALAFMASIFAGRSDRLFIAASIDLLSGRKGCQRIRPDRRAWPGKPTSAWPLPHRAGYRADFPPCGRRRRHPVSGAHLTNRTQNADHPARGAWIASPLQTGGSGPRRSQHRLAAFARPATSFRNRSDFPAAPVSAGHLFPIDRGHQAWLGSTRHNPMQNSP